MTDQTTELNLLDEKVSELIARYKQLQAENLVLQTQVEEANRHSRVLKEKNLKASQQIQSIISNLQSISNSSGN